MRYPPAAARFSGIALPASVEDLVGGALHLSLTPNAPIFSGKKQAARKDGGGYANSN